MVPYTEALRFWLKAVGKLMHRTSGGPLVGVIASLAIFFIAHIAMKTGSGGPFFSRVDWLALLLVATAALALLRYKVGVIAVIAACGLAGLVARLAGFA